MSTATIRSQLRVALTALAVASCSDDVTMEVATDAVTGTDAMTTAPEPTSDPTLDAPTTVGSDPTTGPGDATGTTAPVDMTTDPDATTTTTTTDTSATGTDTTDTTAAEGSDTSTGTTSSLDTDGTSTSTGEPVETDTDSDDPGVWCGATSTGALALEPFHLAVGFAPSNGGPYAFAGWVSKTDEVRVARYDIAAATWGEPTTLQTGYGYNQLAGQTLRAAVDGEGNAILAYVLRATQRVVVQHYDVVTDTWTPLELPGSFVDLRLGKLSMTPNGHAVLSVQDTVGPGYVNELLVWFYDPVTSLWSEPATYPKFSGTPNNLVRWAQDPETGDAALAIQFFGTNNLLLQHHDTATDVLTSIELDTPAIPEEMASIGAGEFTLVSSTSDFKKYGVVYGHHFDGVGWLPPEPLGEGVGLKPVSIVGGADGRAVASWNDNQRGTYARTFDHEDGWGDLLTASPTDPMSSTWASDNRVALDGDGFLIVYSISPGNYSLHTYARKYDGSDLDAPIDLDPEQPGYFTRINRLTVLGPDRARAVWSRYSDGKDHGWAYACLDPMTGWSPATALPSVPWRIETRPGGDVLVMTSTTLEYFAAN